MSAGIERILLGAFLIAFALVLVLALVWIAWREASRSKTSARISLRKFARIIAVFAAIIVTPLIIAHFASVRNESRESVIRDARAGLVSTQKTQGIKGARGSRVLVWDDRISAQSPVHWKIGPLLARPSDKSVVVLFVLSGNREVVGRFDLGGEAERIDLELAAVQWPEA